MSTNLLRVIYYLPQRSARMLCFQSCLCNYVCPRGRGPHKSTLGPVQTCSLGIPPNLFKLVHLGSPPQHLFKLVHYTAHISIGKRAVGLRRKVLFCIFFTRCKRDPYSSVNGFVLFFTVNRTQCCSTLVQDVNFQLAKK